jgi:hypothetical protein
MSMNRVDRTCQSPHQGRVSNRIYYGLKPFVLQSLRTAIRRRLAMRLRKAYRGHLAHNARIGTPAGELAWLAGG